MLGEKLGDATMRVLRERGIDVRLGITLKEAHSNHVVLADDSRIDTHTVASVTGVDRRRRRGARPRTTTRSLIR